MAGLADHSFGQAKAGVTVVRCASCGSELRPRDRYCDSCGEPVRDDAGSPRAGGPSGSEARFVDAGAYSGWEPLTDAYPLRADEPRRARA